MKIEVWSDVVCPWCYIGKRRLEAALADLDEDVEVVWRSFELDRSAPRRPDKPLDEALATKYRTSLEQTRRMIDRMTQTAADEGLDFDFDSAQPGNTFDAHRVIHFAAEHGKQGEMKERLLSAYMTEGRPIAERDELARLAGEVGLDAEQVRTMLSTEAFEDAVRRDEAEARQVGVTGVPFFLIDEQFGIAGAQTPDVLLDALERVRATTSANTPEGPGCEDGSCRVPGER